MFLRCCIYHVINVKMPMIVGILIFMSSMKNILQPRAWSLICLYALIAYIANRTNPDQTAPQSFRSSVVKRNSLIRVHIVCFQGKGFLECI